MHGTVHGLISAFLSVEFALLRGVFGDFSWVVAFGFLGLSLQLNVLLLEAFNFFVRLDHPSTSAFSPSG